MLIKFQNFFLSKQIIKIFWNWFHDRPLADILWESHRSDKPEAQRVAETKIILSWGCERRKERNSKLREWTSIKNIALDYHGSFYEAQQTKQPIAAKRFQINSRRWTVCIQLVAIRARESRGLLAKKVLKVFHAGNSIRLSFSSAVFQALRLK